MSKIMFLTSVFKTLSNKQKGILRYHLGFVLTNTNNQGWTYIETAINNVSSEFSVKKETAIKKMAECKKEGFGHKVKGKYYYCNQEKLAEMLGSDLSMKTVSITFADLCTNKQALAFFEMAVLANSGSTIARQTRIDKLNGSSRQTQRNREKLYAGVKFNYGVIKEYDKETAHEMYYEHNQTIFRVNDNWCRQLPNTYNVNIKTGKRRRRWHGLNMTQRLSVTYEPKLYYSVDDKKAFTVQGTYNQMDNKVYALL